MMQPKGRMAHRKSRQRGSLLMSELPSAPLYQFVQFTSVTTTLLCYSEENINYKQQLDGWFGHRFPFVAFRRQHFDSLSHCWGSSPLPTRGGALTPS